MTDEQRAELKRLAENAPSKDHFKMKLTSTDETALHQAAEFYRAANPAAVLDLLAKMERLSEDLVLERRMHKAALDENEQLWAERDRAESDNAALLAVLRRASKAWAKVTTCRLGVAAARDDIDPITRVREEAHPGAALLAEHAAVLAEKERLRAALDVLERCAHAVIVDCVETRDVGGLSLVSEACTNARRLLER